ncbi:MAG TPA: tetratricopeptide repeat protein [Pyrinomonadaceae bacterium]|nr:tetratricopeptide repeat protein [Pyrinomonadaceae bacterium]
MSLEKEDLAFGSFVLDTRERIVKRDGEMVPIPPKALGLLLTLIENRGQIVEKDRLIETIWPDTFVEEGNLTYTVRSLRKILGDDAERPTYIETIPRRGYRFIAEVRPVSVQPPTQAREIAITEDKTSVPPPTTQEIPHGSALMWNRTVAMVVFVILVGTAVTLGFKYFSWEEARASEKRSVAVLPFANESGNPEFEYLSDGISESLINGLSELRQLRVVARATAFAYKNRNMAPHDIGRELKVEAVLAGKVAQVGDSLVVQADLIDVADGTQIWGERYTQPLSDLPSIPQRIARELVKRLQPRLSGDLDRQLQARMPESSEAYQLDLKGRFFWNRRTEEGLHRGVGYFEQAIAEDPEYALAYVGLADSFNVMGFYSFLPPDDSFPRARVAASKALELEELAEAHNSLAYATLYYDWDLAGAEKGFLRAIDLKPNYAVAHQWYGNLLTATGRWNEAIASFRRAQELDPLAPVITAVPAWTYYYARQYDRAIEPCRRALELDPNFALGYLWLGQAYERKGDHQAALREFKKAMEVSKGSPEIAALLAHAYAVSGDRQQARQLLNELIDRSKHRYISPYYIATAYVGLGDVDSAFEWLDKSLQDRQHMMLFIDYDSRLDALRGDPRFERLLNGRGLRR